MSKTESILTFLLVIGCISLLVGCGIINQVDEKK